MRNDIISRTFEFIEKAKKKHGSKYDYSKVKYNGYHENVCIICPDHGEYYQLPSNHLAGKGCTKCSYLKRAQKMTQGNEVFIEKSIKVHGEKYDYSKVEYKNSKTKVCIVCNKIDEITGEKHNEFWQVPYSHLSGSSCPKCSNHFMTQEIFIKRASVIHQNKYDYSKIDFKAVKTKVCIICPDHGEFLQTPDGHLNGAGCSKCSGVHRYSTNEWIEEAKKVHGERYDYSKVEYSKNSSKIQIICKVHGKFLQTPANHIKGKNCPKCTGHYMDKDFFINKSNQLHKDESGNSLYDYSLVDYIDSSTHVTIICHKIDLISGEKHGSFSKTPNKHLGGQGCPLCGNESIGLKLRFSNDEFLNKAFPEKFEYLTEYVTAKTKIHIKCKKCNHKFWQEASSHLSGCGCPVCNESKLEKEVTKYLNEQDIKHEKQKRFEWLGRQSLDFYLTDYNIAIECQGIQHFESKNFFGGDNGLKKIVERDNKKLKNCLSNNIEMIYVIDNEEYFNRKYHFNSVEPFSGNMRYKTIHLNKLEQYLMRLIEEHNFLIRTTD